MKRKRSTFKGKTLLSSDENRKNMRAGLFYGQLSAMTITPKRLPEAPRKPIDTLDSPPIIPEEEPVDWRDDDEVDENEKSILGRYKNEID